MDAVDPRFTEPVNIVRACQLLGLRTLEPHSPSIHYVMITVDGLNERANYGTGF